MNVYISGPIKNNDDYHLDFENGAKYVLTVLGHQPVNPATLPSGLTYEEYMRADIRMLLNCEGIYMLKGWERSAGARCEFHVACLCGHEVFYEQ